MLDFTGYHVLVGALLVVALFLATRRVWTQLLG